MKTMTIVAMLSGIGILNACFFLESIISFDEYHSIQI
jgi:hypothetical protein